jgi:hypothetical protein
MAVRLLGRVCAVRDVPVACCGALSRAQAIIDDQSKTEAQRKAARDALKKQAEEAKAIAGAIEKEKQEKAELENKIKEMEGKVRPENGVGNCVHVSVRVRMRGMVRVRVHRVGCPRCLYSPAPATPQLHSSRVHGPQAFSSSSKVSCSCRLRPSSTCLARSGAAA